MYNNNDLRGVDMNKHKKGSIFGIIGLVVIFAVVSFLFFSMISDQIFFKHVKSDIKIEKLNVTLNDAAKKQINNYTSQQVSNKRMMHGEMHLQLKLKVQWIAVLLSIMKSKNINFRFIKVSRD